MPSTPNPVVVLIDTREQAPIPFPSTITLWNALETPSLLARRTVTVLTQRRKLECGDYALQNAPDAIVSGLERKGAIREIAGNCLTPDRDRLCRALDRLAASCPHPYLLLEGSLRKFLTPTKDCPQPGVALDVLFNLLHTRGIRPLFIDTTSNSASRYLAGELIVRILVSNAISKGDQLWRAPSIESKQPPRSEATTTTPLPSS